MINLEPKERTFRFSSDKKAYSVAFEKVATDCHYFEFDCKNNCLTLPAGCPKGVINTVMACGGTPVS